MLISQETPGEVIIGGDMTGQQTWAAPSFQHRLNRKATMASFHRFDCAHMFRDCRVVDAPYRHLPTGKFKKPGAGVDRTYMVVSAQSLSIALYWSVAFLLHTGPTLTTVDTVVSESQT